LLTLKDIRQNKNFQTMIAKANEYLRARGYTEHGMRHVTFVSHKTAQIMRDLGFDERMVEIAAITGYLHDIGNMHNRKHHGVTGANIVFAELRNMGMDIEEVATITTAIANHEEEIGEPISPLTAALILADKSDAHRTRVHRLHAGPPDIHDRVNLAIEDSDLFVDTENGTITLDITFDQSISQVMDYFEIYLKRMEMCKQAAAVLNSRFRLVINELELLGHVETQHYQKTEA